MDVLPQDSSSFTTVNHGIENILYYQDNESSNNETHDSGVRSIISSCEEKFQNFVVTFIKEKMISDFSKSLMYYQSLVFPKEGGKLQRERQLYTILRKCLTLKNQAPTSNEIALFKKDITEDFVIQTDCAISQAEDIVPNDVLCQAFGQLSHLLKELSSFPTFYTNSKNLYDKHMRAGIIFLYLYFTNKNFLFYIVSVLYFIKSLCEKLIFMSFISSRRACLPMTYV